MKIELENIGLDLAVSGFIITMLGVIYNNIFLEHINAMFIWQFSNAIFAIYFSGRYCNYWDGRIGDGVMIVNYVFMLISGMYGLWLT